MTDNQPTTVDRWQPGDELTLSAQYHPAISPDHPAFAKLPAEAQAMAKALHRQDERWSHKRYFKGGLSGRLIAAFNGYHFAGKVSDCMMKKNPHAGNRLGRCNQDWHCEFCAYLRGQEMLKKYAGAWAENKWFELVLSLAVGVCPADPEHDLMADVLNAMEAIIKRLQAEKRMTGYVAWLEIKIHQFYPHLVVTPHIHVIMRCDNPPDVQAMSKVVADEWLTRRLDAIPDLFIAPVKSEAHFYELLQYIKPIDVLGPYDRGYRTARAVGRLDVFHQEVREFFMALRIETGEWQVKWIKRIRAPKLFMVTRHRFFYGGTCHGSAGHPLGLKEAERRTEAHQNAVREKVEIAREVEGAEQAAAERQLQLRS